LIFKQGSCNFIVAALFATRGVAPAVVGAVILILSSLGVYAAVQYICSNSLVYLAVPTCSGATCLTMAKIGSDFHSYSREVAAAWRYANAYNSALRTAEDSCVSMDFNALVALLRSVVVSMDESARLSLVHSISSVNLARMAVASKYVELRDLGAPYAPYSEVRSLYAEFKAAQSDSDVSPLGSALKDFDDRIHRLSFQLRGVLSPSLLERIPRGAASFYSKSLGPLRIIPADVLTYGLIYALQKGVDLISPDVQPASLINSAVGESQSIYTKARPLFKRYISVMGQMDDRAKQDIADAKTLRDRIYKGSEELQRYVSTLPDDDMLSYLVPSGAVEVPEGVNPSTAPDDFRLLADRYFRGVLSGANAYLRRDVNGFLRLAAADENLSALHQLYTSEQRMIDSYKSMVDRCRAFLSSYKPRSDYAKPYITAAARALAHGGNLSDCAQGMHYVLLDKNYASVEGALKACYSEAAAFGGVHCSGDLYTQLQCCESFVERQRADLRASPEYRQYLELLGKIRQLLSFYYAPDLAAEFSSLPRNVSTPKALRDALKRALDLYAKVRERVSNYVSASYDIRGFLDARESTLVPVVFYLGVPGVSLDTVVDLPFSAAGYRILDANGLVVNIRGNRAYLHGGGTALLEVLALPVSLKVERLGESGGVAYLRVSNDSDIPVRYAYTGKVYAVSGAVTYDSNAVYFRGRGSAIIGERVLAVEVSRSGEDATVTVSNPTEIPYSGDVVLPFSAEHRPSYCEPLGDATLCRINLDPFERRVLRFSGVRESNDAAFFFSQDTNVAAPQPVLADKNMPPAVVFSPPAAEINANVELAQTLRSKLLSVLSEMERAYRRAEELNVVFLLPYDAKTVRELNAAADSDDPTEVSAALSLARQSLDSLRSRARVLTYALPENVPARSVALRALNSGDYVLALAIASQWHPAPPEGNSYALYASLLAAASLAVLVYFLRIQGKRKKPKRRLPRI